MAGLDVAMTHTSQDQLTGQTCREMSIHSIAYHSPGHRRAYGRAQTNRHDMTWWWRRL